MKPYTTPSTTGRQRVSENQPNLDEFCTEKQAHLLEHHKAFFVL